MGTLGISTAIYKKVDQQLSTTVISVHMCAVNLFPIGQWVGASLNPCHQEPLTVRTFYREPLPSGTSMICELTKNAFRAVYFSISVQAS